MDKKLILKLSKEQQNEIKKKLTFENLKTLKLNESQQEKIKADFIDKLKSVKGLNLSEKQRNEIEKKLTFKDLKFLNLSKKQQNEIEKKLTFENLKNIEIEDSENWNWDWNFDQLETCETIYEYAIDKLKTIEAIYLDKEQQKKIKKSALKQIKLLKSLTDSEKNFVENISLTESIPFNEENRDEIKKYIHEQSEALEPLDLNKEQRKKIQDFILDIMDIENIKSSGEKLGKKIRENLKKSNIKNKDQTASNISNLFSEGFNELLEDFNYQIRKKIIDALEGKGKLLSDCIKESIEKGFEAALLSQKLLECMKKNKLDKILPIKLFLGCVANELY